MKKCVKDSQEACYYPVASCIPVCGDSQDPETCQCENEDFPHNWVKCTDGSTPSGGGSVEKKTPPNPITDSFVWSGPWCVGMYGDTWCWLANDKGEYAKDGKPYKCSEYKGWSADEWCYHPGKPKKGEEESGSAIGTGGSSGGHSASDTFQCPSKWYSGSTPADSEAKAWTMAHNVFRCMHDVQFAQWSNPVANDIKRYLKHQRSMVHSDSYDVQPPAGPAGENLFEGRPASYWKPANAASSWYSEVKKCTKFPGCTGGFNWQTGHFTAMIWAGVKEIGCSSNKHGVKGCRYKGNDHADCTTPNMGGCYDDSLPEAKKSLESCKAKVSECFGGAALPSGVEAFSLEDLDTAAPGSALQAAASSSVTAALAGLAAMTALFAGAWRVGRGRWRYAGVAGEAALPLDEMAGKEEGAAEEEQ